MGETTSNSKERFFENLYTYCLQRNENMWFIADIVILNTGIVANVPWLWLTLTDRKPLSASKVLGLNLVIMDLIYLSIIPVTLISESLEQNNITYSGFSEVVKAKKNYSNSPLQDGRIAFDMISLLGCPLLLTCMCIERYLAVCRPVTYMKMRKTEYRIMVCAAVWIITAIFCVCTYFVRDMMDMMLTVFIIISGLFIVMLACLGGVVCSLWQQCPAHSSFHTPTGSPVKRRAVFNLLVVVGSAMAIYLPVLAMVPLVVCISFDCEYFLTDNEMCDAFDLCVLFPSFSVLIGPLFFLSKAKQMFCRKEAGNTGNT